MEAQSGGKSGHAAHMDEELEMCQVASMSTTGKRGSVLLSASPDTGFRTSLPSIPSDNGLNGMVRTRTRQSTVSPRVSISHSPRAGGTSPLARGRSRSSSLMGARTTRRSQPARVSQRIIERLVSGTSSGRTESTTTLPEITLDRAQDFAFRRPVSRMVMHEVGVSVARINPSGPTSNFLDVYAKSNNTTAFFLYLMVTLDTMCLQQTRAWEQCGIFPGIGMALLFGSIMIMCSQCLIDLPRLVEQDLETYGDTGLCIFNRFFGFFFAATNIFMLFSKCLSISFTIEYLCVLLRVFFSATRSLSVPASLRSSRPVGRSCVRCAKGVSLSHEHVY
eukprot:TRINITY_DN28810_c0_g1_i2.p1 TRINITY_DN28810_c0_g1~~TRINITY_DN28810_c0_g1_i2.p1  ORF type:complete len:334 (+),score=34.16 TRINITY_DN28810_c0_g1_i2:99-1100(+)